MEEFVTNKDEFNCGCKLRVIGKRWHYFIKIPVSKLYSLEIQNSNNSVVNDCSENDDVIGYGHANWPKQLAAETGRLIQHWINKVWLNDWFPPNQDGEC